MRNASKNTIKRVMRKAKYDNEIKNAYFWHDLIYSQNNIYTKSLLHNAYFLFNEVGAQIYIMSKGKICNRGLMGVNKYCPHNH